MNAWRYDEIDMGGAVEFNWREWAKFHWRRYGSKSNPCTIKIAISRQQNQAPHGSDTGDGTVKAAPKSPPSQQKEQRRHKKAQRNKILAVASVATRLSM